MHMVIINNNQFGYHIDTYYYADLMGGDIDVTYVCYDFGKDKIMPKAANVIYVSREGNWLKRSLRFLSEYIRLKKTKNVDVLFVKYFKFCVFFSLFSCCKTVLDIRTVSVDDRKFIRKIENFFLKIESIFFDYKSVISSDVAKNLRVNPDLILPLAANPLGRASVRNFKSGFKIVYLGTFNGRNIDIFLEGVRLFIKDGGVVKSVLLIGDGDQDTLKLISDVSNKAELLNKVFMPGFIKHDKLSCYFSDSNLGASYVPINDFYDDQPVTKTYEYLASGLPVLATKTKGNMKVVNELNGVLTMDDPVSVSEAFKEIESSAVCSKTVRESSAIEPWSIVVSKLKDFILKVVE